MTTNRKFKRRVRARAAMAGESYTAALYRLRRVQAADRPGHDPGRIRLAVGQSNVGGPHKRSLSIKGPAEVGPADWQRFAWGTVHDELIATSNLARDLQLWAVLGSVHRLSSPQRPHNSLYVISDTGQVVTRYDERYLSKTKISYMYSAGSVPITFEVDGFRFGCALGMESHFPEVFAEYEVLGVDCVLLSTTGGSPSDGPIFATEAQGHAAMNSYCVSFSVPAQHSAIAPSGIIGRDGRWSAQCPSDGTPGLVAMDLEADPANAARSWRRAARDHVCRAPRLEDPRSEDRVSF
jgi:predicted amidohydrolase